jgi:hypothetical protein
MADKMDAAHAAGRLPRVPFQKPCLEGDFLVGAALLWGYARDLLTGSEKDVWTREELLVALDLVNRDPKLAPPGHFQMIAELEPGERGEVP